MCDVASYIRKCTACIKSKPEQRKFAGRMGAHSIIDKPWEVLSIDIIGSFLERKVGLITS